MADCTDMTEIDSMFNSLDLFRVCVAPLHIEVDAVPFSWNYYLCFVSFEAITVL